MPIPSRLLAVLTVSHLMWSALPAQSLAYRLNKPPAGVEEALRERITQFFALQTEGKFRQGEKFICEDSKDAYYDSYKNRWSSVKIDNITWEDSFQTGKVLMVLGTELKTLGGSIPAQYPMTTIWKLQDDKWCYAVPPVEKTKVPSPFGPMNPGEAPKPGDPVAARGSLPTVDDFAGRIGLSKKSLQVMAFEDSSDSLEIVNSLSGPISFTIHAPDMPGLKWTLSKTELKAKEKATLSVDYKPVDKTRRTPFNLNLVVEPTGSMTTIPVIFTAPPVSTGPIPLPPPKK